MAVDASRPSQPIAASIDDLAWIAGRWEGRHPPDQFEEWWAEPAGGTMVGMFRWLRHGAPRFYELLTIEPEEDRLVWRIKHFGPGLVGWEEREDAVTLDLVALDGHEAVLLKRGEPRWMVYRLEPSGELVAYFETDAPGHDPADEFRYARR